MNRIFLILALSVTLYSCKESKNNFSIKGDIKKMSKGEIYFIASGDVQKIDTVKVENEHFTYEGNVTEPTVFMANFGPEQKPAFLIVDKGNMTLNYEMGNFESIDIKGGKDQEVYANFLALGKPIMRKMDSLGQVAQANDGNESVLASLQEQFYGLDEELKKKQFEFISTNKSSVATAFIGMNYLNEKMDKTVEDVEKVYGLLDENVKKTYYGKKLAELSSQMKSTVVGAMAPDFSLSDVNGKVVSLSSFKGKYTLVDFWASWCGPCRAENPNVVAAYNKFHNKGFEILAVSLDEQKDKWMQAIEKDNLTWTQVSDLKGWQSDVAAKYGVQSIPSNFMLDKEGKIIAKNLRGEELENMLNQIIK